MNNVNQIDNQREISAIGHIFKVSMPVMLSQFIMTLSGFISALILSFVSLQVFSASMLISSIQLVITIVPFAIFFCLSPVISHTVASKQEIHKVGVIFRASVIVSLIISVLIMLILAYIKPILLAFGQPADLVNICNEYYSYFLWGIPAMGLSRVTFQVAMGLFRQNVVLWFSIVSIFLSSLLGYVLVLGKWGFPYMGVAGLGLAFVIQAYATLVVFIGYLLLDKTFVACRLWLIDTKDELIDTIRKLIKIGAPISLQTGNELLSFFVTTLMVGWLGATALMAKQITVRYLLLLVIPLFGIGQAASVFVGKFNGSKQYETMKQYGNQSILMGVIYSLIVLLIFIVVPKPFIAIFIRHDLPNASQFYTLVEYLLIIVAIGQVFDAIRNIAAGALRGLGDTKYAMMISVLFVWPVGIPLAYLFGFTFHWGLIGISVAHDIATLFAAGLVYFRWKKLTGIIANHVVNENLQQA